MKEIKEKEEILKRIEQLLEKAEIVKGTGKPSSTFDSFILDKDAFLEWKTNVENLIILITGKDSVYYQNFVSHVGAEFIEDVEYGIGVLRALKEDLELGYLTKIKDLVIAEVFTDFLDMAEHLLENGYKDPAASLIGAVLENGLRKISEKHNIPVKSNDDIGSLNTKIADKEIYNRSVQKQIQAWKAIRDNAAHGKFDEYKSDHVKSMLEGVRRFLGEHL